MKINKIFMILVLSSLLIFISGCGKEKNVRTESSNDTTKVTIVEDNFDKNGSGTLKCTTEAYAQDGVDVDLSYTVIYENGNILSLHSISKITSSDSKVLDDYEKAYRNISNNYVGLKYYDTKLVKDSNTVTYETIINYDKINTDKLLDIEGEEDNVIVNGKAKLSLWLELASKFGTTCREV